jgi:hypothetical protein
MVSYEVRFSRMDRRNDMTNTTNSSAEIFMEAIPLC